MADTTSLQRLVEDYLADCRTVLGHGLAPKSLHAYGSARARPAPWYERRGIAAATSLRSRTLNRFTSELLEQGGRRGRLDTDRVRAPWHHSSVNVSPGDHPSVGGRWHVARLVAGTVLGL